MVELLHNKHCGGIIASFKSKINEKFGTIDVLVNNAGISQQKLFTDITDADWEKILNTNLVQYICILIRGEVCKEKD